MSSLADCDCEEEKRSTLANLWAEWDQSGDWDHPESHQETVGPSQQVEREEEQQEEDLLLESVAGER